MAKRGYKVIKCLSFDRRISFPTLEAWNPFYKKTSDESRKSYAFEFVFNEGFHFIRGINIRVVEMPCRIAFAAKHVIFRTVGICSSSFRVPFEWHATALAIFIGNHSLDLDLLS